MGYTLDTSKDSKNFTPAASSLLTFGYNRTIEGITIHWWGLPVNQPTYEGIVNYLLANASNTSAHYVATGTGRRAACIVSPMDVAHHTGSAYGNAKTIGIECDPRMRDEDYDVVAELIADIRSAYGDVPIYSHNMWTATQCPGGYDINRLDQMSYTKVSHDEWGAVTDKNTVPTPVTPPSQPAPTAPAETLLYRVYKGTTRIGAFAKDINAWNFYTANNATKITFNGADCTDALRTKFTAPSPTTGQPDSGLPVSEKYDYTELEKRVSWIESFLETLFKTFKRK